MRVRSVWLVVVAALAVSAALPSVGAAQTPDGDADPPPPGNPGDAPARVLCPDAAEVFYLMCEAFMMIRTRFVDPVSAESLAEAAARGVREAGLAPRSGEAAACALPSPEFDRVCDEIEAVDDAAAAVWAASAEMLASLDDRHSRLITAEHYERSFTRLQRGVSFRGIGLRPGLLNGSAPCPELSARCRLAIAEVFPDSPAEEAGLLADDIILELDGLIPSGPDCGISGLRQFDVGTPVVVRVERDGRVLEFRMEAAELIAPVVSGRAVSVGRAMGGSIGYLRLASFTATADERLAEELQALLKADIGGLVLDLRGNLGGYLSTVVNIAGLFLNDDQVVTEEVRRDETLQHLAAPHEGVPEPPVVPIVVAVDGSSASASELLSLAMRGHGRAVLVGTMTFGKGTGQITQAVRIDDETVVGAVRLTVLRWLGPTGASATGGIEPDVEVEFPSCLHPIGVARQVAAAAGLLDAPPADIGSAGERFEAVTALADSGIFDDTGCEPGLFCPDKPLTRSEFAVWLVRVLDGADPESADPESQASGRFTDVEPDQWWSAHVERLAELGVTEGCSREPARFCPDDSVSRGQMASFLRRAFYLPAAVPAGFTDISDRSYRADASALYEAGITLGCASDPLRFCPDRPTSRGEMALFLQRARHR